jgi:hypothetical protein
MTLFKKLERRSRRSTYGMSVEVVITNVLWGSHFTTNAAFKTWSEVFISPPPPLFIAQKQKQLTWTMTPLNTFTYHIHI